MKVISSLALFFVLVIQPVAYAQPNLVLCWIFKMQGCPEVEPQSGAAITSRNDGRRSLSEIGAKRDRVERRNIITVPDYKIRNFLRSLGLGGRYINTNYSLVTPECYDLEQLLPYNNLLLRSSSSSECLNGLQLDLDQFPLGLNLKILRCQDRFCNDDFIQVFEAFLQDHPKFRIPDPRAFLGCSPSNIEV